MNNNVRMMTDTHAEDMRLNEIVITLRTQIREYEEIIQSMASEAKTLEAEAHNWRECTIAERKENARLVRLLDEQKILLAERPIVC